MVNHGLFYFYTAHYIFKTLKTQNSLYIYTGLLQLYNVKNAIFLVRLVCFCNAMGYNTAQQQ